MYFFNQVCLNKLDDLQLAMVIARLYEGEIDSTPPNLKRLLYEVSETKFEKNKLMSILIWFQLHRKFLVVIKMGKIKSYRWLTLIHSYDQWPFGY